MSVLHLKQTGTTENYVPAPIINGVATRALVGDKDYDVVHKGSVLFSDPKNYLLQENILAPNIFNDIDLKGNVIPPGKVNSMAILNSTQSFHSPLSNGNIDLTWFKIKNMANIKYWNDLQNMVTLNRQTIGKINYDSVIDTGIFFEKNYAFSIMLCDGRVFVLCPDGSYKLIDPTTTNIIEGSLQRYGWTNSPAPHNFTGLGLFSDNSIIVFDGCNLNFFNYSVLDGSINTERTYFCSGLGSSGSFVNLKTGGNGKIYSASSYIDEFDPLYRTMYGMGSIGHGDSVSIILTPSGKVINCPSGTAYRPYIFDYLNRLIIPVGYRDKADNPKLYNGQVTSAALTITEQILMLPGLDGGSTGSFVTNTPYLINYDLEDQSDLNPNTLQHLFPENDGHSPHVSKYFNHGPNTILPDGRNLFCPLIYFANVGSSNLIAFDPFTQTMETIYTPPLHDIYTGSHLLKDGRVLLIPRSKTTSLKFLVPSDNIYGFLDPNLETYTNQYINKSTSYNLQFSI